mgnify:CR=1 FL=1
MNRFYNQTIIVLKLCFLKYIRKDIDFQAFFFENCFQSQFPVAENFKNLFSFYPVVRIYPLNKQRVAHRHNNGACKQPNET